MILFVWVGVSTTFSQSKKLLKADDLFQQFNFEQAIDVYKQILEKGEAQYYATCQIGASYSRMGNSAEAVSWYKKAIEFPDVEYDIYRLLSNECKKQKLYDEADEYLIDYHTLKGDEINHNMISHKDRIKYWQKDSLMFNMINLSINTKKSEFAPVLYEDQLVFSSNKPINTAVKRSDVRNDDHFYKLYKCKKNSLASLGKVKAFDKSLKSRFNDGPISFNSDASIAFSTRNTLDKKGTAYLNVFVNHKKKGHWQSKTTPIPLAQKGFSQMHAFLTHDEEKMYFVSDIQGGFGGTDIYVANYRNGFLSPPVNLGPTVNTSGNESFPFVNVEGVLFFTSDGHEGFGGLDLFYAVPDGESYSKVFNMGYPVNTASDDFNLILIHGEQAGYMCSNREGGVGEDDIYAFSFSKDFTVQKISGQLVDSVSQKEVSGGIIQLLYRDRVVSSNDAKGNGFQIYVDGLKNYTIVIKHRYYKEKKLILSELNQEELSNLIINLDAY